MSDVADSADLSARPTDLAPDPTPEISPSTLPPTALPPDWHYEATVAEVETIIDQIEMGELELAEVFEQFANAVTRLRQCEGFLNRQQQQVDLLIETLLDESE